MSAPLKRILFVIPKGSKPGAMSFALRLADALRGEKASVEIYYVRTSFLPWVFFKQGLSIWRAARSGHHDVINAQFGTYTGLITTLFARLSGVPVVVTFRGSDLNPVPSENPVKWLLQHLCSQIAAFLASGVICVSEQVCARIWVRKRHRTVIPSSTDLEHFKLLDPMACRATLKWEPEEPICLFFTGSNSQVKRVDLAQEVKRRIAARNPGLRLEIVSDVRSEQMPVYLNAADCLLFLSDFEGSPNLIREACACNLPIVTVDVGDVRNVLKNVGDCTVVERDLNQLTQAVLDQTQARRKSDGRNRVMQYSNPATAQKVLGFYIEIGKNKSDAER